MILLDLRWPMGMAATVVQTQEHPLTVLRALGDRSKAVMMVFNQDFQHIRYSCMAFNPADGQTVCIDGDTPGEAFEIAKAEYQRDTGPTQALQ